MKLTPELRNLIPWYVGTPLNKLRQRKLMALQVYVDDSGRSDPPVFVLAGFVASVESWLKFNAAWDDCLSNSPALEYFKMADANRCNGVFRGFSKEQRNNKLFELASVIEDHIEFGVSTAIPHKAFDAVFKGRMMKSFDTPYTFAFHMVIAMVHKCLRAVGNNEEVDLIFDRQLDREKDIKELYPDLIETLPEELSLRFPTSPIFADDRCSLPLQAADMLAWHIRRSWKEGRDKLERLSAAGPVINRMLTVNEIWTEEELQSMFGIGQEKIDSMNTMFPHQAKAINEGFEFVATAANIEQMEMAEPFIPVELVSFPAIGMKKYQFVRSCSSCDIPHLHKRFGNRCLATQTAVWSGFGPQSS